MGYKGGTLAHGILKHYSPSLTLCVTRYACASVPKMILLILYIFIIILVGTILAQTRHNTGTTAQIDS